MTNQKHRIRYNKKVDVLLIYPNLNSMTSPGEAVVAPLGLAYIASYVRSKGIDVELLDATALDISDNMLEYIIQTVKPRLVGITSNSSTFGAVITVADIVKDVNPESITLVGGRHATALTEQTLNVKSIDFVGIGEGEVTTYEVAKSILDNNGVDAKNIAGLAWLGSENEVCRSNRRQLLDNLDELPYPSYDLLPIEKYRVSIKWYNRSPVATMVTSRGCPYKCTFCDIQTISGRSVRYRSTDNIINEIRLLVDNFGIKEILFYDDTFTLNMKRTHEICDAIIAEQLGITWCCLSRVNCIDWELLKKMKKAGCHMISYGLETGSEQMLASVDKSTTLHQAEEAIYLTKQAGIHSTGSFVFGLPGETVETMRETIEWAKKVDPTFAIFFRAIPFVGTPLHTYLVNEGLYSNSDNWENYLQTFTAPAYEIPTISSTEVMLNMENAWKEFYLRPSKIIEIIQFMTSWYKIKGMVRAFYSFTSMVVKGGSI